MVRFRVAIKWLFPTPPQNEKLNAFENDMYNMIRNTEFVNIRNEFLDNLNKDIKSIQ